MPLKGKNDPLSMYLKCLIKELSFYQGARLFTLYIGGGTPSLLEPADFSTLLERVKNLYNVSDLTEFTVETNPESLTLQKARTWMSCGVNRVSVGVQSFSDAVLARAGRIARSSDIYRSIDLLRKAGFNNINIDLILGLQGEGQFREDLEKSVKITPTHISVYQLTIGENRAFKQMIAKGTFKLLTEEQYASLYQYAVEFLDCKGYRQYEISNFSKEGYESLHNMNYWMGRDYRGVGLGAVSTFGFKRMKNCTGIEEYCKKILEGEPPLGETERLSAWEKRCERIMLALRMKRGVDMEGITRRAGEEKSKMVADFVAMLKDQGYAQPSMKRLVLTPRGFMRSNSIISELLRIIG